MKRAELSALTQFDELPASAHVRLRVVAALFGISTATVWRWSKSGQLPEPVRMNGVTMWNVAALRSHMPAGATTSSTKPLLPDAHAVDDETTTR